MHDWLHPVLDRFKIGLVPVDADPGRRKPVRHETGRTHSARPVQAEPHSRAEQEEWIPRSILYGPQS